MIPLYRRDRQYLEHQRDEIKKDIARLHEDLQPIEVRLAKCWCGARYVGEGHLSLATRTEDGWTHKLSKCWQVPKKNAVRCQCEYVILNGKEDTMSFGTYGTGDDSRKPLIHTAERCFEDLF